MNAARWILAALWLLCLAVMACSSPRSLRYVMSVLLALVCVVSVSVTLLVAPA